MTTDCDDPRENDDEPEAVPAEGDEAPGRPAGASDPVVLALWRRRRRPVPTWDEIVFGARPE